MEMLVMKSENFCNIFSESDASLVFHILMGARGMGKTYSALAGVNGLTPYYYVPRGRYLWLRRTQDELETILSDSSLSPFTKINNDFNIDITSKRINKKIYGCYFNKEAQSTLTGYMGALSTMASLRGADFSDVSIMIYDEFVPEQHVKKIPHEANAIFNLYETVNRNREMFGMPAVQMYFLSNSNNIYNDLCSELGIVNKIEKAARCQLRGQQDKLHVVDRNRSLEFKLLESSKKFKDAKSKSALYKLTAGTKYSDMALDNKFAFNDFSLVKYCNIKGYRPVISIDNIYLWSNNNTMYATYNRGAVGAKFASDNRHDILAINRSWRHEILSYYMSGCIFFETYEIKHKILQILEVIS